MPLAPYTKSYYRQLYRQLYASPSWTRNLLDLPWIHMFDDHEIINDYSTDPKHTPLYPEAIDAFAHYQLSVNPPPINPAQPTYTSFNIGQVAFFVLDNRSFRSAQPLRSGSNSTGGQGERTMLGVQQLADLRVWVDREGKREGRLLVLVSGVPVTRNWSEGGDEFDSWAVSSFALAGWVELTFRDTLTSEKRCWKCFGRWAAQSSYLGTGMSMVGLLTTQRDRS